MKEFAQCVTLFCKFRNQSIRNSEAPWEYLSLKGNFLTHAVFIILQLHTYSSNQHATHNNSPTVVKHLRYLKTGFCGDLLKASTKLRCGCALRDLSVFRPFCVCVFDLSRSPAYPRQNYNLWEFRLSAVRVLRGFTRASLCFSRFVMYILFS